MSNRRTLMAVAAVILALVAGVGVYSYASNADSRAQSGAQFVDALVADTDIAKGTTGAEVLQAGLVHTAKVARNSVPVAIVADPNSLANKVAAARIDAKQFITTQTFITPDQGGGGGTFAAAIATKDLVAMSISVDQERGVANQIAAGDHVDVAITKNVNGVNTTTYLLNNLKVLAVGAATIAQQQSAGGTAPPVQASGLLTFEVTPDQALQLISAKNDGNIYLVLLPPGANTPTTSGGTKAPAASR
ncbi:MAG TPA: Flp pilus assembly protein CpaB [Acidimicrobiia bacterium]